MQKGFSALSTKSILRSFSSLALGFIVTLVVFGLMLGLFWALIPDAPAWKLGGAIVSAALALCAGGFMVAGSSRTPDRVVPALFGLFFGGISFLYILGPGWIFLACTAASALLAALGGILFRNVVQPGV